MSQEIIRADLLESAEVMQTTALLLTPQIEDASRLVVATFQRGGRLFLAGNGGSAAEAQHIATEYAIRLRKEKARPALPAIALTTDTSALTASVIDFGAEYMFSRQLEALGRQGDTFMAISTSGNSPNILEAVKTARTVGITVIGLTGAEGGRLKDQCDLALRIPSSNTAHIQEVSLAIQHIICKLVEESLFV